MRLRGISFFGLAGTGLLVAALFLAVRVFHGVWQWGPVAVASPLNAQSALGLLAVLLLVCRAKSADAEDLHEAGGRSTPAVAIAVAAVTFLCFIPRPEFQFLSDDYCLLGEIDRYVAEFPVVVNNFFFRPVGFLLFGLLDPWAGLDSYRWHLAGAALHALCTGLVFLLLCRLGLDLLAAAAGAAVFGLHGSRPEAVVWISGWFDVCAALFVVAGLLLFLWDLRRPHPALRLAALVCAALAMLSKETGFAFPLLLPVLLYMERQPIGRYLQSIGPFVVTALALFVYRWIQLDGSGGYAADADAAVPVLGATVFGMLKVLVWRVWAVLFFPWNWSVEPALLWKAAAVVGIGASAALAFSQPDRRKVVGAVAFLMIASLPAIQQLLIGADMEKSRGLYLPSVGFALLLGAALQGMRRHTTKIALAGLLALFHFAALRHNLAIWANVYHLAASTCGGVANELKPEQTRLVAAGFPSAIQGVYCFRNCFKECVEAGLDRDIGEVVLVPAVPAGATAQSDTLVVAWDAENQRVRVVGP